jgi:hypothetical protein
MVETAEKLLMLFVGAALGGFVSFAWSQVAFGNRLTRVETKLEVMEKTLAGLVGE